MPDPEQTPIADAFFRQWYDSYGWHKMYWRGAWAQKLPMDLFQYQEIIYDTGARYIIECGAYAGGSTLFFADLLTLMGGKRIFSIDIEPRWHPTVLAHPLVTTIHASSTSQDAVSRISIPPSEPVFVILDSDHSKQHVYEEMCIYSNFVPPGCFMVVEDTCLDHPICLHQPGPWPAVDDFLAEHPNWTLTEHCTRMGISQANHGFLKRLA